MPDMYAIQTSEPTSPKDKSTLRRTPNIIPCRIHHDGPVDSDRYWTPTKDEKGTICAVGEPQATRDLAKRNLTQPDHTLTAHFRGRKLRGRRVALPAGYQGVVAIPTERMLPSTQEPNNQGEDEPEAEEPVKILETQGTFDDFVVWGHETPPAADDAFVKGVEEWLQFADAMHTTANNEVKQTV